LVSNSIVDSGTNSLFLAPDVFNAIVGGISQTDPALANLVQQATQRQSVPMSELDLTKWPTISFLLQPDSGTTPAVLECEPSTYWQTDAPTAGQASFMIGTAPGMIQSILGLPLLNDYFAVFDRSMDPYGTIRFAPIKAVS
jgi:hypothetical protein